MYEQCSSTVPHSTIVCTVIAVVRFPSPDESTSKWLIRGGHRSPAGWSTISGSDRADHPSGAFFFIPPGARTALLDNHLLRWLRLAVIAVCVVASLPISLQSPSLHLFSCPLLLLGCAASRFSLRLPLHPQPSFLHFYLHQPGHPLAALHLFNLSLPYHSVA